jgi:hypothetical protein
LPPTAELSLEMLLARADSTMYERKHARRQRQKDEELKRPGKSA